MIETLVVILVFVVIVIVFVQVRKKTITPSYGDKEKSKVTYFVNFKNGTVPDLAQNSNLSNVLEVKFKSGDDGYCVASAINDVKLKELLMKEYNLTSKDVIVTYRQAIL